MERAYDGLAGPLADAIVAALEDARGDLGPVAFAVVQIRPDLRAALASVSYRNRARARVEPDDVIRLALEGRSGTLTVSRREIVRAATPEAQRRLRAGTQALDLGVPDWRAPAIVDLAAGLARELNARAWRDAEPEFIAVVTDGEHDYGYPEDYGQWSSAIFTAEQARREGRDLEPHEREWLVEAERGMAAWAARDRGSDPLPYLLTRRAVGDERARAFITTLTKPVKGSRAKAPANGQIESPAALQEALIAAGLAPEVAQVAAADARWAIVLEAGGDGESRLGGLPTLPSDMAWPAADGRPLTHLATVALQELPQVHGRELLPADGFLSFFADVSSRGALYDVLGPGDPGRDRVAVIHTPAGVATHVPEPSTDAPPPDEYDVPIVLRERRVTPTAKLQLRHLHIAAAYDLDAIDEHLIVEELAPRFNGDADHQMLGFPRFIQDNPLPDDEIPLFFIAYDRPLGFAFLDNGTLVFHGKRDDVAAGRWDQLTIHPDSG